MMNLKALSSDNLPHGFEDYVVPQRIEIKDHIEGVNYYEQVMSVVVEFKEVFLLIAEFFLKLHLDQIIIRSCLVIVLKEEEANYYLNCQKKLYENLKHIQHHLIKDYQINQSFFLSTAAGID